MKLYSALYNTFNPLSHFYPDLEQVVVEGDDELEAPAILIIHGGSDIHPSLYNRSNIRSHVGHAPSPRDMAEVKLMAQAIKKGIYIFGICRGAQLACAIAGGILVQHVEGHAMGGHRIVDKNGDTYMVTSAHHQMLYPWAVEHELIAWSSYPRSTVYEGLTEAEMEAWPKTTYDGTNEKEDLIEPEIVWFPTIKCLAIQGHPEWMDSKTPFNQYVKRLLSAYCPTS